jgi:hypothetical protein
VLSRLRSLLTFIDRLPGGGTPWRPRARKDYFALEKLTSNAFVVGDGLDEAMRRADEDRSRGLRTARAETTAAADRVSSLGTAIDDVEARRSIGSWRQALDARAKALAFAEDDAELRAEVEARARDVNHRMGVLLGSVIDPQTEVVTTYAVDRVRIGVAELDLEAGHLELLRWKTVKSWRLDGFCSGAVPASLAAGFYEVWIPTKEAVALTGEAALTFDNSGSQAEKRTKIILQGTSRFELG